MITYKLKEYSVSSKATEDLDRERIYDYEVSEKIKKDCISIGSDLGNLVIWIPRDYEFVQYPIDDCIREMLPYAYTSVKEEGGLYKMTVRGKLTQSQYLKLLKTIIKESEFINIIDG